MRRVFVHFIVGTVRLQPLWADLLLSLPRVLVGIMLPLFFGASKFPPPQWFIEDIGRLGFPLPAAFAWAAVIAEVIASATLAIGLFTRPSAILVFITMAVAAFVQKANAPLWERLPALFFLLNAHVAMVLGSGRFGVDAALRRWLKA